jgi:hypothetical protein
VKLLIASAAALTAETLTELLPMQVALPPLQLPAEGVPLTFTLRLPLDGLLGGVTLHVYVHIVVVVVALQVLTPPAVVLPR